MQRCIKEWKRVYKREEGKGQKEKKNERKERKTLKNAGLQHTAEKHTTIN